MQGSNRWLGKFTGCYSWRILNAFITKKICETITMDFDSLIENKSGLGTAGIVVINKDQDIVSVHGQNCSVL